MLSDKQKQHITDEHEAIEQLQAAHQKVWSHQAWFNVYSDVAEAIDWAQMPDEVFKEAIKLSMEIEGSILARELVQMGSERFPDDEYFQNWLKFFRPTKVRVSTNPPISGLAKTMRWLQEHAIEHSGSWIAVSEGELIGKAASLDELKEHIGGLENNPNALIGHIP